MDEIERLHAAMAKAAADEDYELARRYRDRIALIRGGASPEEAAAADTDGLQRQQPGAMGLGTGQARPTRPKDWKQPKKPDPMTKGRGRPGKR